MVSEEIRAPWWKWALFSLSSSTLTLLWTVAAIGLLWVLGMHPFELMDYLFLSRPPWIREGSIGAGLAFLVLAETVPPLLVAPLFRPARALMLARLRLPDDVPAMLRRLGGGVVLALALQAVWTAVAPEPAEHWRMVEHLMYAVVRGGRFWPVFWLVLVIGVVVPATEEILFRGMLYGMLRRRWAFLAAGLVNALLFGLPHGPSGALPAAVLGFYFAYQTEWDRSLVGPILLHALNNLGAVATMVAQLTE